MPDAVRAPAPARRGIVAAAAATCFCAAYLGGTLVHGDASPRDQSAAGRAPVRAPAAIDGPSLRQAAALPAGLKRARVVPVKAGRHTPTAPARRAVPPARPATMAVASRR